jgi:hypothetical protein
MKMTWIVKDPEVVETVLEDGAVLLNLKTKFYYSLNGVGYTIWQLLDAAGSPEDLLQRVMAEYKSEDGQIAKSVPNFIKELEREQLLIQHDYDGTDGPPNKESVEAEVSSLEKRPFNEPELIKHDEPLHDVVLNPFDPQLPLAE